MVLVAYSDSEGSDAEETPNPTVTSKPAPATKSSNNFTVDKANPTKIRVNLSASLPQPVTDREDGEPAAKRARIGGGGGAFSGFNSMLPAPKRENVKPGAASANGTKAPARKVFSLKTGAEPAFSREGDAELRDFFADQQRDQAQDAGTLGGDDGGISTIPSNIPKPQFHTESKTSKPFMFKPLSVSRGPKKKKPASQMIKGANLPVDTPIQATKTTTQILSKDDPTEPQPTSKSKPKISLFSSGPTDLPADTDPDPGYQTQEDEADDDDEIIEFLDDPPPKTSHSSHPTNPNPEPESLTSIATTLNLTPAERRQLLGRKGQTTTTLDHNIINFNTDTEYAANQELNASADASTVHNPVRAIAGGKHSLKQLVANAQGQKEALEESFAAGRRNKREAGGRYGW